MIDEFLDPKTYQQIIQPILPTIRFYTTQFQYYKSTLVYPHVTHFITTLTPIQLYSIIFGLVVLFTIISLYLTTYFFGPSSYRNSKVYINDFVVFTDFRPEWCLDLDEWKQRQLTVFKWDEKSVEFTHNMIQRSGINLGKQHIAPGVAIDPPDLTIASARFEAEFIMFNCVERLLSQNNLAPNDIDILIVNCSLFNPTPSLCAMIINKFKFREDIITYNLSGMGCSASPLAVQLASFNLRLHHKKHPIAIVVSLEVLSSFMYQGTQREFLLSNALFRMNGSAVLLSRDAISVLNRPAPKWRIDELERVHIGASDSAFQAIHLDDDDKNYLGVRLSKDLMSEASRGLTMNLTILLPKILPYSELIKTGIRIAWRFLFSSRKRIEKKDINNDTKMNTTNTTTTDSKSTQSKTESTQPKTSSSSNEQPIIPNMKTCVDYWLIHAGGKSIITGIQNALNLTDDDVKASRDVLYKYGNTSSASIWYELDEIENNYQVKNNQHALAIAVGSGIKVQTMYLTSVNR